MKNDRAEWIVDFTCVGNRALIWKMPIGWEAPYAGRGTLLNSVHYYNWL